MRALRFWREALVWEGKGFASDFKGGNRNAPTSSRKLVQRKEAQIKKSNYIYHRKSLSHKGNLQGRGGKWSILLLRGQHIDDPKREIVMEERGKKKTPN